MKKILIFTIVLCLVLCSCNSFADGGRYLTSPPEDTTPVITTPISEETTPAESSVYVVLNEFFESGFNAGKAQAVIVENAYELLDVYRYIMSEDARNWISLRYENVEDSAYNDYLNNTYTPDFFGHGIEGGENYLVAVMIKAPSSSNRHSVTAGSEGEMLCINIENAPPHYIPTDDGGYFIYLVPLEGKYEGQTLTVTGDIKAEQ